MRARRTKPSEDDASDAVARAWVDAVPQDRLAHLVKEATRAFVRALQSRLVEHGVSFGHWTFLRILWEQDGLTQKQLSEQAGVMEPTTFAAVKSLEDLGYVKREHRAGNRKNLYVSLTPRGKALKRKLVPLAEEVNQLGAAGVDPAHITVTRSVLAAIIANLARDAARRNESAASSPRRSRRGRVQRD